MKKYILLVLYGILLISLISFIVLPIVLKFEFGEIISSICGISVGIVTPYYITFILDSFGSGPWNQEVNKMIKKHIISKNEEFRISYGFLFRIHINGKYFLIPDSHQFSKFKVPGGTYEIDEESKNYLIKKYGIREDDVYDNSVPKDDYRLIVKAQYLEGVYKFFDKSHKGKMSLKEISTGLKNALQNNAEVSIDLGQTSINFARRDVVIKYPKHFKYYEMLIADIYEVRLNGKMKSKFEEMFANCNEKSKFYFANSNQIIRRGVDLEAGIKTPFISDHTYKILPNLPERVSNIEY